MRIDRELLHKYDQPGPRYTSYPTVPEWSNGFDAEDYRAALESVANNDSPLSMYVHIPFCRSRCFYCGCNTCVGQSDIDVIDYLEALESELKLVSGVLSRPKKLNQIHWGGGTPTYLSLKQIERLYNNISDSYNIQDDAEIAIEVDPRITTPEQIKLLRRLGFNRISFGVQDLTPRVQQAIGRKQSLEQTEILFDLCRELKYDSINVDLIYGLPLQTVPDFTRSVDEIIRVGVDRVAIYSFAFLPTRLQHQKKIKKEDLPGAEQKYELFAAATERLLEAGYIQIGMDHFARPEDDLALAVGEGRLYRNFMGYTSRRAGQSVGIGMSSISEIGGCFSQNFSMLKQYHEKIDFGILAAYRGIKLTDDDKIRQIVILELMCNFRLSFKMLEDRFKIDFDQYFVDEKKALSALEDDGLLTLSDDGITVEEPGKLFVRNIAMVFDAYLREPRGDRPQFSRTV